MGRHRTTGLPRAQQAALFATGAATSHRRVSSSPRARSASVLAVGVLAAGVVITAATTSWFQEAALPESRAGEPTGKPDARPAPAPGPVTAPAPAVAPTPPPATVWRVDDQGFRPTPRSTVGAAPPRVEGGQVSVQLTGRGQRSELAPALPAAGEGDQHDLSFLLQLGPDFPVHGSGRQVIARWQNDGPGPAPVELWVRDGHLVLHGGEGHPGGWRAFDRPLGPVQPGQWCEVGLRVCFSANPEKAHVSAWHDGERVLAEHHPRGGTLYPGQQSHLTVGLHRDASIAEPAGVHFRDLRVARTRVTSHSEHRSSSAATHAPSIPEQRSTSSVTTAQRAVEHRATGYRTTEQRATGHRATEHRTTEHRSAESASSRSGSHGAVTAVARNTPVHVTTSRATSKPESSDRKASAGARRAATHAHP
jgi:hypothetical protein